MRARAIHSVMPEGRCCEGRVGPALAYSKPSSNLNHALTRIRHSTPRSSAASSFTAFSIHSGQSDGSETSKAFGKMGVPPVPRAFFRAVPDASTGALRLGTPADCFNVATTPPLPRRFPDITSSIVSKVSSSGTAVAPEGMRRAAPDCLVLGAVTDAWR